MAKKKVIESAAEAAESIRAGLEWLGANAGTLSADDLDEFQQISTRIDVLLEELIGALEDEAQETEELS